MTRPDELRRLLGAMLAGFGLLGQAAHAQVLEIGDAGAITRFEGPAVVSSEGVRPLTGRLSPSERYDVVSEALARSAARHGLNPALLTAVARQESGLRQQAVSPKGAVGVMQLMPSTAHELGVDPLDMAGNIEGGATYLARLLRLYGGDVATALGAYNAGPGAIAHFKGAPPYPETRAYIDAVVKIWTRSAPNGGKAGM